VNELLSCQGNRRIDAAASPGRGKARHRRLPRQLLGRSAPAPECVAKRSSPATFGAPPTPTASIFAALAVTCQADAKRIGARHLPSLAAALKHTKDLLMSSDMNE
jgi:hypothetical protein